MTSNNWAVFRQDFTGNEFLVLQNLSEARAHELVLEFESHKHHQHYWATLLPKQPVDFTQMLREALDHGSTLECGLQVLRNQNATRIQCVKALKEIRDLNLGEAKRLVFNSQAYADQREEHAALVDALLAEIEQED